MKPAAVRRVLGLITGLCLVAVGAAEIAISKSDFESPTIQPYCRAGFCATQFFPDRVFDLLQKATLGDPHGELMDFQRGVQLSPASAYRWADLADAEFNVRDYKQAEYAMTQALQAGPRSPVILLRAANLYFQIGDNAVVVQQLAKVLNDPGLTDYYDSVFLTYSRLGVPISDLLKNSLPQRKEVLSSLLAFFAKTHKTDEAIATWQWASARHLADEDSTGRFFAFLINAGQQADAQQLWQDYATKEEPDYRRTNWIFNPGFDRSPHLSPFDWNTEQRRDVTVERVQDVKYDGDSALRIRFNGETNTAYHQTFQLMVLPPGRYNFSAMVKSEQVTTDEGVRLHIFDPPSQAKVNVWTDSVTGTQDWKQVSKTFEVPGGVKLLLVEVARNTSNRFDNKIGGTTWVDHLTLSKQ